MDPLSKIRTEIAGEFPIKEQYAFFNHAGVAPIPASTQMAITQFARVAAEEGPVNYPAWLHGMSLARSAAAEMVHCSVEDICFVKNTSHGLMIVANSLNWSKGDNMVGLAHEFPANIVPWKGLARFGVELRLVPERQDFTFALEDIAARIDSRTKLVAVSWVEYSTGFRNNLQALSDLCRERGVMLCVDAIQGLGVLPIDLEKTQIDFLTADGHKWLLGPEGCGILYVRRERIAEMNDSMCGWCGLQNPQDYDNANQPFKPGAKRFEEGSHNLMTVIALGTSLRLMLDVGQDYIEQQIQGLTDRLMAGLDKKGYRVITPREWDRRAGIVSFIKGGHEPSRVAADLQNAEKIVITARRGFLRASPHFYNDSEEIDRLIAALP